MAMTLTQLQSALKKAIGNRTDYSDAELLIYLNMTQERLARQADWPELRQTSDLTLPLTASKANDKAVDISSLSNLHKVYNFVIENSAQTRVLTEMTPTGFDKYVPLPEWYSRGDPEVFTLWSKTEALIWPVNDTAFTARIRWYKWPTALSASSGTSDFDHKDDLIIFLTASFIFTLLREDGQAKWFYQFYSNEMNLAMKDDREGSTAIIAPNFLTPGMAPSTEKYRDPFNFEAD